MIILVRVTRGRNHACKINRHPLPKLQGSKPLERLANHSPGRAACHLRCSRRASVPSIIGVIPPGRLQECFSLFIGRHASPCRSIFRTALVQWRHGAVRPRLLRAALTVWGRPNHLRDGRCCRTKIAIRLHDGRRLPKIAGQGRHRRRARLLCWRRKEARIQFALFLLRRPVGPLACRPRLDYPYCRSCSECLWAHLTCCRGFKIGSPYLLALQIGGVLCPLRLSARAWSAVGVCLDKTHRNR